MPHPFLMADIYETQARRYFQAYSKAFHESVDLVELATHFLRETCDYEPNSKAWQWQWLELHRWATEEYDLVWDPKEGRCVELTSDN